MWRGFIVALVLWGLPGGAVAAQVYDLVVYGGSSAGVIAAVQAARMGKTAVIVEPSGHLGGLTSGGLGMTDFGNQSSIGGVSREFYRRVKDHYDQEEAWKFEAPDDYPHYEADSDVIWRFEPHVAEEVYREMLREEEIRFVLETRLDRQDGVTMEEGRITSITTLDGETFRGRVFVDATYEGDLMAAAGVPYTVGRESNGQYNEQFNGVQKDARHHQHFFNREVDPYVEPGDPSSGTVARVHDGDPGENGEGDHRVQAYCYRMCMTKVPENRVPWPKPDGYDAAEYELLFRNYAAGDLRIPLKIDMMPNGKTDTNNQGAYSTDNIGQNYGYPEASYAERETILAEHERYQKGLMWTLANHPRVPEQVREEVSEWGLAKDEFTDNGHWPHQIYVREARRMIGKYVMTEHDCRRTVDTPEPVGLGSYTMDSHNVQRYVTDAGHVQNEGDIGVHPGGPYEIAYGSLVPKAEDCSNLLVPICLSASHIAYGSIRMEPVFMVLGQSAATAAVQAIDAGAPVQEIDYTKLKKRLLADGQVVETDAPPKPAALRVEDLEGIVLDAADAERTGQWEASSSVSPYVGHSYHHDNNEGKGEKAVRYSAAVPRSGEYEVRLVYSAHANRATRVPVYIEHAGGQTTLLINQREEPDVDGTFMSLGAFRFTREQGAVVTISNQNTDGYVIADGVQLIPGAVNGAGR